MHFNNSRAIIIIGLFVILSIALPVSAVTYNYDSNNRMLSADYGEGQVYYYQYDAVGNLRGITEGLQILSTTPENGAVGIAVYGDISAVFNTAIALGISDFQNETVDGFVYDPPVETSTIRILDENNFELSCSASIDNNILTVVPGTPLDAGKTYRVIIPADLVTSFQYTEMTLAGDYEFSFTTASAAEAATKERIPENSITDITSE